jgi:hypothetical protein
VTTATAPGRTSGTAAAPTAVSQRRSLRTRAEEALLPPLVALLLAIVVGDVLILAFGQSPSAVYRLLLEGTWGNPYGFGQVLYKATTLVFTGLAFAIGVRAGLFNIGAESQLAAGGFVPRAASSPHCSVSCCRRGCRRCSRCRCSSRPPPSAAARSAPCRAS